MKRFAAFTLASQRTDLSALLQATSSSSMACTSCVRLESGFNLVNFSKSVNSERPTCARTVATCSSAITRRSCSTPRAPSLAP